MTESAREVVSWCSVLALLLGATLLAAFTLVEIAERLVELGGQPLRTSAGEDP